MAAVPLGPDDAAEAVALWEIARLTRPWNDPHADFALALSCPTAAVLGRREGDRLVATVLVGHDGHRGWLYYLAVAPDRQGRGLGRAIVTSAEAWLRERAAPAVQLMLRTDNHAAAGFYAALGYEPKPVVVMGRRLDRD